MFLDEDTKIVFLAAMHLDPAASIISLLGGLSAVAKAANTSTTSVQRWRRPKKKGGTDGYIPRRHYDALLQYSQSIGVQLKVTAFIDVNAIPKRRRK